MFAKRSRIHFTLPLLIGLLLSSATAGGAGSTHVDRPGITERQAMRTAFISPGACEANNPMRASESDTPSYQWHTYYGPGSMILDGDMAVAEDGSIYITGQSGCWLGDGEAPPLHPCSGEDMVVLKLDSQGAYQWHTFYGSDDYDDSYGIALSEDGGVVIVGVSVFSWLGDGGAAPLHPHDPDDMDLVVVKLDKDGNYQWHTFYGSNSGEIARGVAAGGDGNIYIAGQSQASWTGDGGALPLHPHSGVYDLTVLKLDSQGAYQWHTFYGSSDYDYGRGIAVASDGSVYISGHGHAGWLGEDDAEPLHPYSGDLDIITLKLDSQGAYQWHTFYGSSDFDLGQRLAVLQDGSVYVTGLCMINWQGDGGAKPLHPHSGFSDIFALKLDSRGAYQWHTFYGSAGRDSGVDIAVAGDGRAYISGYSASSWLGDGGADPLHSHSENGDDFMLMRLDGTGAYQWHTFYGAAGSYLGSHSDKGSGNALAEDGSLYTLGFSYASWLGDSDAQPLHPHSGWFDITVLKLLDEPLLSEKWIYLPLIQRQEQLDFSQ